LAGEFPSALIDYLYPKSGEENPDGSPQRLTTMFYPREFAAIAKHMQHEGVVGGLAHTAMNKASPVMGLVHDWATNVDSFGGEISDPDAPLYQQLQQKLAYSLESIQPIAVSAIREQPTEKPVKSAALNFMGFSPAPKYATETKTQGAIKHLYQKYHTKKQTPYERARFSQEARDMRKAYEADDMERYSELLDGLIDKYELNASDRKRLEQTIVRKIDTYESMFKRLTPDQQMKLLDKMTEEERDIYLRISNKAKVRFKWQPPEEREE
jgi:polyhydroxyalkanoate synthesis regulator phasin